MLVTPTLISRLVFWAFLLKQTVLVSPDHIHLCFKWTVARKRIVGEHRGWRVRAVVSCALTVSWALGISSFYGIQTFNQWSSYWSTRRALLMFHSQRPWFIKMTVHEQMLTSSKSVAELILETRIAQSRGHCYSQFVCCSAGWFTGSHTFMNRYSAADPFMMMLRPDRPSLCCFRSFREVLVRHLSA